ncbi:MAG: RHS repeat-associated core domain-containing protein [Chloroflexota bacterium]|nr:RHS repeat-associated core domain-containing protein [Chloroflexota bacterium]
MVSDGAITTIHDSLNHLTSAAADYSSGESFEYRHDAVGNRLALTETITSTVVTTYTYDAANRLTSAGDVTYTWDDRGNLISDGTFTYAYNGAGRMVRADSLTVTLAYTYSAAGLRVAQSVDGDVTTFAWDWASGVPEMLSEGDNLYLVGHDTLGVWDGAAWAYHLPDALGSVRQAVDGAGGVASSREWTPYGVEPGGAQAGLGYTGEWWDASVGLLYLRARWYDGQVGRFTQRDPWIGDVHQPPTLVQDYAYVRGNPIRLVDPTGMIEQWWEDMLRDPQWRQVFLDSASRHNLQAANGLSNESFAAVMASIVLIEGGNLGGVSSGIKGLIGGYVGPLPEEQRIPIVACVKNLEITLNTLLMIPHQLLPVPLGGIQQVARDTIGFQSAGIVNIDPDAIHQANAAGIELYHYDTSETYSGDSALLQVWSGHEQWIEHLAASFELVTKRAQGLGVNISIKNEDGWPESVRAFAQWHKEGIVEAFTVEGNWYDEKELAKIEKSDPDWAAHQRAAQESATQYYQGVTSHWWAALTGLTE